MSPVTDERWEGIRSVLVPQPTQDPVSLPLVSYKKRQELESFDAFKKAFHEYRANFGIGLERWRRSNGWTQDTCQDIGKLTGTPHVYGSKWSQLERGTALNPGPMVFHALGFVNKAIALKLFLDPGVLTNQNLREKLKDAKPILHEDGSHWEGKDFFAAFTGQLPWPNLIEGKSLTAPQAEDYSHGLHHRFARLKTAYNLSLSDALELALGESSVGETLSNEQKEHYSDILVGMTTFKPAELKELWQEDKQVFLPTAWLNKMQAACQRS